MSQDTLGWQASRISKNGPLEIGVKYFEDGSKAVGLFNRGDDESGMILQSSDLRVSVPRCVRDLWRQQDLGKFAGQFHPTIPLHSVVLPKVTPMRGHLPDPYQPNQR